MNRIITADVKGEYIKLSSPVAGAAGSHNAVTLEISFDDKWADTTRKVYFFDARGETSVFVLLTLNLLKEGTLDTYLVPIPSEGLASAGEMTLTIRGVVLDELDNAERIMMAASVRMTVLQAETPASDVAPVEPTPTQAEQLQAEIDGIKADISGAAAAAIAAAASADAASASAIAAASSASTASAAALAASASETAAAGSETAAASSSSAAALAKAAAEAAQSAAVTAKTAAETAQGLAQTAKTAAETAETNAETAETNAETAQAAAVAAQGLAETANTAAQGAKTAAEAAQAAAEISASNAADSEENAEAWAVGTRGGVPVTSGDPAFQNNSKYYKDQAEAIVGNDFLTKTGDGKDVTVTFTEAATRANIASGEKLATMFGKLKKLFTDLGTAAFSAASDFAEALHSHTVSAITDFPAIPDQLSDLSDDTTHRLVTDTEKTAWNAKQAALTFDSTPTEASANPVTSGGVKAALDAKAAAALLTATAEMLWPSGSIPTNPLIKDALERLSSSASYSIDATKIKNAGRDWTKISATLTGAQQIATNGTGTHVIRRSNTGIYYSTNNGATWTAVTVGGASYVWSRLKYVNGYFVLLGYYGFLSYLAYSTNGISWSLNVIRNNSTTIDFPKDICYATHLNKFVVVGYRDGTDDAYIWDCATISGTFNYNSYSSIKHCQSCEYFNGMVVVGGLTSKNMGYSTNLTSWTQLSYTWQVEGFLIANSILYATCEDGVAYSSNGTVWTYVATALGYSYYLAYDNINDIFLTTANNQNKGKVSYDGCLTWELCEDAPSFGCDYDANAGRFIGVYSALYFAYSEDVYQDVHSLKDFLGNEIVIPSAQLDQSVKMASGSYTGTGTYGSSNKNSLTFDFVPKYVEIVRELNLTNSAGRFTTLLTLYTQGLTSTYINGSSSSEALCYVSITEKTIYWYNNSTAGYQCNTSGETYRYRAFG